MVLQFFTKTRPNLDVPFFEDSLEGKPRADAIIQLALDHPELVIDRTTMPLPATELTWTGTWTFCKEFFAFGTGTWTCCKESYASWPCIYKFLRN